MTARADMEAVLEAALFVAAEPLARDRLLELFDAEERPAAEEALATVLERYAAAPGRGVMVEEVGGGVRLATRPELHADLRRFFQVAESTRLSMAALETLAIVAYRQPVTAPEIQELRGVQPTSVLKTLLERRLVRISGRKKVVGKPFLYSTTRAFLLQFGLDSLDDLPPLEEFEELYAGDGDGGLGSALDSHDSEEEILRINAELDAAEEAAD